MTAVTVAAWASCPAWDALGGDAPINPPSDPVLNLMLEKGMITEAEAAKVQAQADALRTNPAAQFPPSKWNVSEGIKSIEVFGDLRLRYEERAETAPAGHINLDRYRYALRVGLRGEAFDDFTYGFRLETSSNPRSSWVTMGSSSSGNPYQGPYGKATAGITVGQIYAGWQPASWFELTVGKMPNPLYTTPMVWASSINPEGLAEHLKYTVGEADFFANFGQFLYQDENPAFATGGLGYNGLFGQTADNIFQIAWQGGVNYHITTNITAKVGATIYQYYGLKPSSQNQAIPPYFGDGYVGEGAYTGPGSANAINGYSGYGTSSPLYTGGYNSLGFPNNQVGVNNLLVLEVPFELNFKFKRFDARIFGDVAYNLDGYQRAQAAAAGYAAYLAYGPNFTPASFKGFRPQTSECKAYQIGLAIGSKDGLGLVNGSTSKKHAWEVRSYWQHVEQYALDPNLVDQDFFAGALNMQGFFGAVAYGFSDNFIGTFRYGRASRINRLLGTGGTGQDIQQINPIDNYDLYQVDLTFRF